MSCSTLTSASSIDAIASATTIGGLNAALAQVEQDMRREFRNPQFTIPGQTPGSRVDALADAIAELNHGSKQQLYRQLQAP